MIGAEHVVVEDRGLFQVVRGEREATLLGVIRADVVEHGAQRGRVVDGTDGGQHLVVAVASLIVLAAHRVDRGPIAQQLDPSLGIVADAALQGLGAAAPAVGDDELAPLDPVPKQQLGGDLERDVIVAAAQRGLEALVAQFHRAIELPLVLGVVGLELE